MKNGSRQWIAKIALTIFGFLLAIGLAEGGIRILALAMHRFPFLTSDARAGWANLPNIEQKVVNFGNSRFILSTDSGGRRIPHALKGVSPGGSATQVVLVGDSFVFGLGVNDEQTVGAILARETPYWIVNLGVVGYGTDQELVKLEEFLSGLTNGNRIAAIIVFAFDNDFVDVQRDRDPYLGRTKPRFNVKGELIRTAYTPTVSDRLMDLSRLFWVVNSKRATMFADSRLLPRDGIEVVISCLRLMRRRAEANRAQVHVLLHHRLTNGRQRSSPILDETTGNASSRKPAPSTSRPTFWRVAPRIRSGRIADTGVLKDTAALHQRSWSTYFRHR